MTLRATWDRPAPPPERTRTPGEGPRWTSMVSWEELLTFGLMLVVLLSVVVSVERANWVTEMPRLTVVALAGLVSGWLLGRTRAPSWALHLAGVGLGAAVVLGMTMYTLVLSNPLLESGVTARWSEMWERVGIWFDQFLAGDVSTDPLPFVLLVVFATWALAYIAAWAVVRWKNPWLALVPGGVALLTNISYLPGQPSLEFIVFLFAGILLFARLHLQRTVDEWGGDSADTPPWLSLEVLNLATWVGVLLIVVAWVVPTANNWGPAASIWSGMVGPIEGRFDRAGRLFAGVNSKQPLEAHTFGSVLPLKTSIRLDGDPLFNVLTDQARYLRGATYDEYTSNGWKQTDIDNHALPPTTVEAASFGTQQTKAQFRDIVTASITMTNEVAKGRLFAFGDPLASDRRADLLTGPQTEDIAALAPDDSVGSKDEYTTVGSVSGATADRLVTASPDYPEWVRERYLQLPDDLPPEVRDLASQIAGRDRVPFVIATKVEKYLRDNYPYSNTVGKRPPLRDAVAYFLFDARKGYFDYHASSMVVMLRSLGIPARLAIGFALSDAQRDETTQAIPVSEQNSWAWPEVYFPGYGWVEFNPTPGLGSIGRAPDDSQFLDPATGLPFEDPTITGIDPSLVPPEDLMLPDGAEVPAAPATTTDESSALNGILIALLAVAALILTGALGGRYAWAARFRGLTPASQRWAKLQLLAGWAGITAGPTQTPNEEAAALSTSIRPRVDVSPLARAYVAERYGGRTGETPEAAANLDALYARARGRLVRSLMRKYFRVGR